MLNLSHDEQMEDYFRRFNAQLKRMPPQDRAEVHLELRQHLEALVAAHKELGVGPEEALVSSLNQFGDPVKIGRRMFREWHRTAVGTSRPEMKAALAVLALYAFFGLSLSILMGGLLTAVGELGRNQVLVCWNLTLLFGVPLLAGAAAGRWFAKEAIVGSLYGTVALTVMPLIVGLTALPGDPSVFGSILLWAGCWLPSVCVSAYVSSARRQRQWYRVRLSDLKLRVR